MNGIFSGVGYFRVISTVPVRSLWLIQCRQDHTPMRRYRAYQVGKAPHAFKSLVSDGQIDIAFLQPVPPGNKTVFKDRLKTCA